MPLVLLRLAVTIYHYLRLWSHLKSRVQPRIHYRLPILGMTASPHQTWQLVFVTGPQDLDEILNYLSDRRLLAPTPPGNQSALAHHPHLLLDASKRPWTLSFNDYVSR